MTHCWLCVSSNKGEGGCAASQVFPVWNFAKFIMVDDVYSSLRTSYLLNSTIPLCPARLQGVKLLNLKKKPTEF